MECRLLAATLIAATQGAAIAQAPGVPSIPAPEPRTQAEAACRAIGNPEERTRCLAELPGPDQPSVSPPPAPAEVPAESPSRPSDGPSAPPPQR